MKSRTLGQPNMPFNALKFPVIASVKYDGRRTTVKVSHNNITYITSGGKEFKLENNYPFSELPAGIYFAEMMGEGVQGKLGDRKRSGIQTTMFTNTSKGMKNRHKPTWRIFYYVTWYDYEKGVSPTDYTVMFEDMVVACKYTNMPREALVESRYCETMEELMEYYDLVIADGWEGLMVAQPTLKWKDSSSRLKTLVKMKEVPTMKGVITAVQEGTGKYEGLIGSLVVKLPKEIYVNVGSGLTDSDRGKDPEHFIGRVAEIAYEQLMDGMPQQPRYKGLREAL